MRRFGVAKPGSGSPLERRIAARLESMSTGSDWTPEGFEAVRSRPMPRRFPTQLPLGVTDRADPRTPLQREARPPQLVLVVDPIVSAAVPAVDGERDSWITGQQFEADLLQWETDQESEQRSEFGTISDTELRAGRVHRCEGCNGQILIGDRHRKHTYRLDGDLKTERYCLSCTLNDSESSRRFDDSQCDYNGRNDFDPNAQTGQHWRK